MKTIAVFVLLLFSCHPLVTQHRTDKQDKSIPISVLGILAIEDSTRSLNFCLLGKVHESCLSYSGYRLRILQEDSIYWIQAVASKIPGKNCKGGGYVKPVFVPFTLLSRHKFTFRFWQSDSTTVDTTLNLH